MAEKYNFGFVGHAMSFNVKVLEHIHGLHIDRLKDYMCAAFDTFNPNRYMNHPCAEVLGEAKDVLVSHGWKVGLYDWGEGKGMQMTCVSPDGKWYRSRFNHENN